MGAEAKGSKEEKAARKAEKERLKEERRIEAERERIATPHFKGGDIDKFESWVRANLRLDYGMLPPDVPHIRVDVPFYVEADGSVTLSKEETPSRKLHPRLVSEIERVILFSPEWDPAHDPDTGLPVRARQELSLTIKNQHYMGAPRPAPRPRGRRF